MKTALIGLGMVAPTFAKALGDLTGQVSLKGVFARNADSRAQFVKAHAPGAIAYESVAAIAADPELDFVILATPPNARLEIVEQLALAKKPILMEKPVERTLQRAEALCALCERHDVPLGIVLQHRMRPAAIALRQMIEQDRFGRLSMVEIAIPWWRPQTYYDEPGRGTYARDGGGVMISQAIHAVDLALSLTGPVASVTALTATTGLHRMESEDFVSAGLQFANGAVGQLLATTAAYPGRGDQIRLHYERCAVSLEGNSLHLHWHDGLEETVGAVAATGAGADPMAFTHAWHQAVIADFAQAIQGRRPPLVTGREALKVHALIEAITRSAQSRSSVDIADQS